jgi:Lon protease-like protein
MAAPREQERELLALFPLPNLVLFPAEPVDLHIFEPRYRRLVADLLVLPPEQRRIGMILGDEMLVEPGTAGRVVAHEALADGRSNLTLLGLWRFAVEDEVGGAPYRRAMVRRLADEVPPARRAEAAAVQATLVETARELANALGPRFPATLPELAGLAEPARFHELANRLASRLDLPIAARQELLALDPVDRARELVGILAARHKVVASLAPFRRLASAPELN